MARIEGIYRYLFDAAYGSVNHFAARWLFLRALGFIYFSAFYALLFQVRGLIGPRGILPATDYLAAFHNFGMVRFWYVPTLLWFSSSNHMLMILCWAGLCASICLVANFWPRMMLLICFVCFLSFVSAAQDFSGYQSDGMLLEAGFLSLFLAPSGLFPGFGTSHPFVRAPMFLLLWEWFRIYFESGIVKLKSGDPTWRNLTAMYEYYQNGPLPTWVGWYLQHLPHWFHIATAAATLVMELGLVWLAFLPRFWKISCCIMVTVWQVVVIATANYAFLNYLVLILAVFLLDDASLQRFFPLRWRLKLAQASRGSSEEPCSKTSMPATAHLWTPVQVVFCGALLVWIFYATTVPLVKMFWSNAPLSTKPVEILEPFRIANQYGLFAVMTPHRYEIEFQGSNDGEHWTAYPFRYKPQELKDRPRIYAPYQPRFDWNLWFASLGSWQQNLMVPRTEELLLENNRDVLGLFASNPFPDAPPKFIRAVLWQYWFSTPEQKQSEGLWWQREYLGGYAPTLTPLPNGRYGVVEEPTVNNLLRP